MLKNYFILSIAFLMSYAQAADPFDHTQRNVVPSKERKENDLSVKISADSDINCTQERKNIAQNTPYSDLHLVGIIDGKKRKSALFVDGSENIFNVMIGETIAEERFILTDIYLKEIYLQNLDSQCQELESIIVRL